jgi:hypothetical protein
MPTFIPENPECQIVVIIVVSPRLFQITSHSANEIPAMNMSADRSFSAELTRSVCGMAKEPAVMLGLKAVWHGQHQHLAPMNTLNT